ncbi:hypothetical protein DPQ22_01840 [Candidatus Tokpelaia sp.]|nr:hypothetical protein DPQ22_01840 [Candidatus Tokpelaia sp.]
MRKYDSIIFIILSAAALTACGTPTTTALFKPHTTTTAKQMDLDQCKIASFRAIPQAYTTNYVGGFYDPGDIDCYRSRRHGRHERIYCDRLGGFYMPPASYTEDLNAPIRWRFVSACLRKKGYYLLPGKAPCRNAAERARALRAKNPAELSCNPDVNLDY